MQDERRQLKRVKTRLHLSVIMGLTFLPDYQSILCFKNQSPLFLTNKNSWYFWRIKEHCTCDLH